LSGTGAPLSKARGMPAGASKGEVTRLLPDCRFTAPRGLEGVLLRKRESHVVDALVPTLTPTRGMLASRSGALMAHTSCNIPLKALTLGLRGNSTGFSEVETFGPAGQRKPQE
jgi:hypothetical protein